MYSNFVLSPLFCVQKRLSVITGLSAVSKEMFCIYDIDRTVLVSSTHGDSVA